MNELVLKGIDGSNPLGFLAAIGAAVTARSFSPSISVGWRKDYDAWRPFFLGYEDNETAFAKAVKAALFATSGKPFEIEKKLPFPLKRLREALKESQIEANPRDRRNIDILGSFGSEACTDKENVNFQDTFFRMVRSGDAAGQGLPFYALSIRNSTGEEEIYRTLFETWDYKDKGFSLRWNPCEDQRYALRWHDPSKNKDAFALGTMNGANTLALEALSLFPAVPLRTDLATTGFFKNKQGRVYFTWPIWEGAVCVETVRSILALHDLYEETPPRKKMLARGIMEIYRCERIAPNQYYRNFSPAMPA
ncbi:MAG: hypothetical protein C4548_01615 [Desulfobacteraceae bacterium]|nr:MAG: hypothetical protein C4548_01615 [Desulfobacteraceae bacterium]